MPMVTLEETGLVTTPRFQCEGDPVRKGGVEGKRGPGGRVHHRDCTPIRSCDSMHQMMSQGCLAKVLSHQVLYSATQTKIPASQKRSRRWA